jgi:hypothetical protein
MLGSKFVSSLVHSARVFLVGQRNRLLRAGCKRPRDRRAADKCDELASPHSITSSAANRTRHRQER